MKKIIYSFFLIVLSSVLFIVIYLSTIGVETFKFNNVIINEIKKKNPNAQISLNKIKIKLDLKKIQVYLSTLEPQIIYQNIQIPITEINIYLKISPILKSKYEITQTIISLKNFKTEDIQKLAIRIKPSNFKTYLLNNFSNGKIEKIMIDLKLDKNLNITDYKVNGSVKKIKVKIFSDFLIQDLNLNFISDKNLTLINAISANYQDISLSDGSLSVKNNKDIEGKFNTQFNLNENSIKKLFTKLNINFLNKNKVNVQGTLLHEFKLKLDDNFKLVDYDYKSSGNISESKIVLKESFKSSFIEKQINKILISKTNLEINLKKNKKKLFTLNGFYNLGGKEKKKI